MYVMFRAEIYMDMASNGLQFSRKLSYRFNSVITWHIDVYVMANFYFLLRHQGYNYNACTCSCDVMVGLSLLYFWQENEKLYAEMERLKKDFRTAKEDFTNDNNRLGIDI